ALAAAGFDGIELWEDHLDDAVLAGPLPIVVFNTYVSFDEPDDRARRAVVDRIASAHAVAVKFNIGADRQAVGTSARRGAGRGEGGGGGGWGARPPRTGARGGRRAGRAAEDRAVAARLLDAAGPTNRVGAIVHTHESADQLRARFAAYGERIAHVHVNHLDAS